MSPHYFNDQPDIDDEAYDPGDPKRADFPDEAPDKLPA